MQPLENLLVLDFTTLLPGPLATLMLAEAGAEVIKVERPGTGDEMRQYPPFHQGMSLPFALLNRGKKSLCLDLKNPLDKQRLLKLVRQADVLVEQFRPGVMARLELDYSTLSRINPRLVYCSLTGYGQQGEKAGMAGHDLNYLASTGMLSLATDEQGRPVIPPALIADIAGGSYPAVINILMALRQRDLTGKGTWLDIAMSDNLFPMMALPLATQLAGQGPPRPGGELLTGGSPRYQVYATADKRYLAAAPLEQRFWEAFCEAIELPEALRDDQKEPAATLAAVTRIIRQHPAAYWTALFSGKDTCTNLVNTLEEALASPHFKARNLFSGHLTAGQATVSSLPVPVDRAFRSSAGEAVTTSLNGAPELGAHNALFDDI